MWPHLILLDPVVPGTVVRAGIVRWPTGAVGATVSVPIAEAFTVTGLYFVEADGTLTLMVHDGEPPN